MPISLDRRVIAVKRVPDTGGTAPFGGDRTGFLPP